MCMTQCSKTWDGASTSFAATWVELGCYSRVVVLGHGWALVLGQSAAFVVGSQLGFGARSEAFLHPTRSPSTPFRG